MSDINPVAILELKTGKVKIELLENVAPNHVARIKELIAQGFYNGLKFHRVIDGFMAQTGCPEGTGFGGSGKKIKAEFSETPYVRGTVGAARSASPDSADSQFFITFGDTSYLNGQYTVWGQVIEGMEHVDKVARGEPPSTPDTIISFTLAA